MTLMPPSEGDKKEESIDTVLDFGSLMESNKEFKDSISNLSAEQKQAFEAMKDMKMSMRMNSKTNEMSMGFGWSFNNISELKDAFNKINKAQSFGNNKIDDFGIEDSPLISSMSGENQNIECTYNKKSFTRNVSLKKNLSKEDKEQIESMLNMSGDGDILNGLKYTIVLNFPKPIKSVNNKNATFSNNRKTVEISYPISTYMYKPDLLSLKVKLK